MAMNFSLPSRAAVALVIALGCATGAVPPPGNSQQAGFPEEFSQREANRFWIDNRPGQGFDLEALGKAGTFLMQLHGAGAEDALLAAGAALVLGIPSIYVVEERKQLPWFLTEADASFPHQVRVFKPSELGAGLPQAAELRAQAPQLDGELPQVSDSFLGCLMSGLSEEQYQEGARHLRAIAESLRAYGGVENPFCEGIAVKSTNTFGIPAQALRADLAAVQTAKYCVFYVHDRKARPSGMWVELGAALALGKPSVLLTPGLEALPPVLRQSPWPDNLRVVLYESHAELLRQLQDPEAARSLLPRP